MRIIAGKYGRRRFDVPTTITARPTTDMARENLFNVLNNIVDFENVTVLDLFAGTGAISFEFLSRGAERAVAVEKATTQARFIAKVKEQLHEPNLTLVKGDVFRFIASCRQQFDIIFADPPYDLPQLPQLPQLIIESAMVKPGTLIIVEHSRDNNFSHLPQFSQQRVYGKVNFSFFVIGQSDGDDTPHSDDTSPE
ncbi:MAG: 16S rRNA (guanine(966)-N(2))-methyltransferase RsmD [Muribaculaceae bacterium]|nr:16S rRNA (guanine(966)-N(2))-methyltransferase RsmD [Muribaculaceae bacterium]